ncbi:ABC transporter permease [Methanoregula sp.]|uniref:ABC transporter permease n=1 Tax=Methanoregula sp. TaxID=2052170 RepID=UPI00236E9BC0|nr:ABC transporter permease [Methanoregula sp.]MDD1686949.1 ABC transporter permease [Methanoregula sp.]
MKSRHLSIIAKKEFRGLLSERTILLAVLLQLFVALFSSFLMVGLTSMYDLASLSKYSHFRYNVGYAGNDSQVLSYLYASPDFRVYRMDLSTGVAALKERKLAAMIWVPDTSPDAQEPVKITLYTLQNDLQSAIVDVKLKDIFLRYEKDLRQVRADRLSEQPMPLEIPPSRGAGEFFEFVYGLLIPLLVFMPAIIASALIIDLITEEYQHDTLETLVSTPVTFSEMVWGKILACEVLVPVQAGIWLLLLMVNGIAIQNAGLILLHVTVSSMVLILLGALTALHYRERTAAQFIFSTALVVVILFSLALPSNPMNLLTRLSVGMAGTEQWLVLAVVAGVVVLLAYATQRYAERISRINHTG